MAKAHEKTDIKLRKISMMKYDKCGGKLHSKAVHFQPTNMKTLLKINRF